MSVLLDRETPKLWTPELLEAQFQGVRQWRAMQRELLESRNPRDRLQAQRNRWVGLESGSQQEPDPRGNSADGLSLASFTTSAPVFPVLELPKNYWAVGKILTLHARGRWGATATPTMTWRIQNTVGTTITLVTSAAITLSALTNQAWELDVDIQCRGVGVSGSLYAEGSLVVYGAAAPFSRSLPETGTAPAAVTVDTTIAQSVGVEVACSASSASNTVKGTILKPLAIN